MIHFFNLFDNKNHRFYQLQDFFIVHLFIKQLVDGCASFVSDVEGQLHEEHYL